MSEKFLICPTKQKQIIIKTLVRRAKEIFDGKINQCQSCGTENFSTFGRRVEAWSPTSWTPLSSQN
jgi:hypothetical protein